jgi:hypothetical protein
MKKILIAGLFAAIAVNGCATMTTTENVPRPTAEAVSPARAVFAAQTNYNVALAIAVAYKGLPRCAPGAPPLCSNPEVVADLQKMDTASSALLRAAQATVRTPGLGMNAQTATMAATQAVAAFTTITGVLRVK